MRDLSEIGVLLLMFVAGLETDVAEMRRVGKVAFWSAFGGVVLPFVAGAATASAFGFPLYWDGIFIGTILTATSVSISAQTLIEIGALRSREGATILGAAVIDDVMGIVLLSLIVAMAKASVAGVDVAQIATVVVRLVVYFALALAAGRGVSAVLAWARGLPVSQGCCLPQLSSRWSLRGRRNRSAGSRRLPAPMLPECSSRRRRSSRTSMGAFTRWRTRSSSRCSSSASDCRPTAGCSAIASLHDCAGRGRDSGEGDRLCRVGPVVRFHQAAIDPRRRRHDLTRGSRADHRRLWAREGLIGRDVFSASVIVVLVTTMVTPPLLRLVFPPRRHVTASVEETIAHAPHISN